MAGGKYACRWFRRREFQRASPREEMNMDEHKPHSGPPRWVKVSVAIVIGLILVIAIAVATGIGGRHGPGRHSPAAVAGDSAAEVARAEIPADAEPVRERFESYTVEQAEREGYVRDAFCLDASDFGQPAQLGAMGFHATDETLLRGPIDRDRPQALLFDSSGRVVGVEYEIVTDAVSEPPALFGQTFEMLPPHAGVEHEHYALHLWFVENPGGPLADFNPNLSCPRGTKPGQGPAHGAH
jgi:hypothetical protein